MAMGLERRGADPVVEISHMFRNSRGRFKDPPDIRPLYLGGGLAGAIGQQDDSSAHATPQIKRGFSPFCSPGLGSYRIPRFLVDQFPGSA